MLSRIHLFIQPPLARVHVARKAKRHNKLDRDHELKRWPKRKPPRVSCPWPCPSITPAQSLPEPIWEVLYV